MIRDKRVLALFALALAAFFYIANHGAYRGYFQSDDLDNLAFTRQIHLSDFLKPLVVPQVFPNNFRPVGHLFYRIMGNLAGLNYSPYIAFLHGLHLINTLLLWFVLRRLGITQLAACAGALFFSFHMAVFDVFWKPMYVFDLFCCFFCLLAVLAYLYDHWLLALAGMWLAYRSKEVAIMLPVVLLAYEFLVGQRRWKRLIPFFALSIVIGLQAIVQNHYREESDYTLHFSLATIWTCIAFYSSKILLMPYAGLLVLLIPFFFRDRRVWWGMATFCTLLVPMLLLPGRLFGAYLYVPLIGLSIAVAALLMNRGIAVLAVFFALWLPWNYVSLRRQRNEVLADARDRRAFVAAVADLSREHPRLLTFLYNQGPYAEYGAHGAVLMTHPVDAPIRFATLESPEYADFIQSGSLAVLSWDPRLHQKQFVVKTKDTPDASYLTMNAYTPIWQLERGWYPGDANFRWTAPSATARVARPAGAKVFELKVNVSPDLLREIHHSHVTVLVDGRIAGEQDFTTPAWHTMRWTLAPAPAGSAQVEIRAEPAFQAGRPLGIAVGGFGFVN